VTKILGNLHEDININTYKFVISLLFLLRMRNVSDKCRRENQNTHFTFNNFSESRAVYEIRLKNMVQPDRPQITIQYDACALPAV
jgi:hypothetical protein